MPKVDQLARHVLCAAWTSGKALKNLRNKENKKVKLANPLSQLRGQAMKDALAIKREISICSSVLSKESGLGSATSSRDS
jgi:hypothetical protein